MIGAAGQPQQARRAGVAHEADRLTHGVPAYVVFHDATLETIAELKPRTPEQLRGVSGVGDRKLERYGAALLEIVRTAAA